MAVQLTIPYETLVALVEQLPPDEQQDLLRRLRERTEQRVMTDAEWQAAFRSLRIDAPLGPAFSLRRADWYDDDER
ncbi:MAG TPA: hypothetical protein VFL91_22490 [Thermomicrobiales bacterium]|nr:hypothetical protein [Thermomicrobiales bacterium]